MGPKIENLGPSHLKVFDIRENTPMHDSSSASIDNLSFASSALKSTILTKLQ